MLLIFEPYEGPPNLHRATPAIVRSSVLSIVANPSCSGEGHGRIKKSKTRAHDNDEEEFCDGEESKENSDQRR